MITVVDDVVTKGATLLGAASLLAGAFPRAEIRAFALVRTQGYVKDIERILDPVVGRISRTRNGGADRQREDCSEPQQCRHRGGRRAGGARKCGELSRVRVRMSGIVLLERA